MNDKVRLGDVFSFIRNGANIKQGLNDSGYPITRIETISDRTVNREKMGYAGITDVSKYDDYILQNGDILMSHINSEKHLGKIAIYKKQDNEKVIHGMNLLCLRPEKSEILPEYAFYFLSSVAFLRQIPNITKKSVNQASFTVTALKELSFAKCNINEQKRIINELDKITDLIDKRKKQLSKLDELVKARFVELFTPFFSQQKMLLGDLCETITKGTTPTTLGFDFVDNGVNFIKIENISANEKIDTTKMLHISEECNIKLKRSTLKENDILFSIAGTKMGITAKVTSDVLPANTNQALAIIRLKKEVSMNVDFLIELLHADMIIEQIESMKSTVAQTNLSLDNVRNFNVIVPPIELQNQFAAFVEQTDKSKLEVQKSLEKLELLKKALMQKYFG